MSDELESLRRIRETVGAPDPATRAAASAPWEADLTDTVSADHRHRGAFGWRVGIAAAAVVALATGGAIVTRQRIDSVKPRHIVSVTSLPPASATDPAVFLFVGSDSREFVHTGEQQQQFGDPALSTGARSDSMMLVRVDPGSGAVLVVSIPRDLFVTVPGCGLRKIDAAFSPDLDCGSAGHGGTQLLVDTIRTDLHVAVNHVIEVDFSQFAALVDQLGGIRIEFATPVRDRFTGLAQPAGCNTLTGTEALAFVRSRHFEWFDGTWKFDPTSDLGRMARQQYALRQLAVAAESRMGTDPRPLLRALFDHVTVDPSFTADDALRFADAMRGDHVGSTLTLPTEPLVRDAQEGLELAPEARPVLEALSTGSALGPTAPTTLANPSGSFPSQSSSC